MNRNPITPTGPFHDFWLLKKEKFTYKKYDEFLARKDSPIRIEDDILTYFNDMFVWIPSMTPEGKKTSGFNYYGPTIIDEHGGKNLSIICSHLSGMLKAAPDEIILTAGYTQQLDDNAEPIDGYYERYKFPKLKLDEIFLKLQEFGEIASKGSSYILHLGI